jgi:1,4-dihydroxy-6-naphthoate synthase
MKMTWAFHPVPNDTFIFDAMVHGRIDTEGLSLTIFSAR